MYLTDVNHYLLGKQKEGYKITFKWENKLSNSLLSASFEGGHKCA